MDLLKNISPFDNYNSNKLYGFDLVESVNDNKIKVFDSSFLNIIKVTGKDRLSFLQGQTTNQLKFLKPSDGITTLIGNMKAKLICRIELFVGEDCLYLLHQASNTGALITQLEMFLMIEDVKLEVFEKLKSITYVKNSPYESMFENDYGFIKQNDSLLFKWSGFGKSTITECFVESLPKDIDTFNFLNSNELELLRIKSFYPISTQEYNENNRLIAELEQNEFVSFSKGCFLGYEILARIKNRGHTNRTLSLIKFDKKLSKEILGEKVYLEDTTKGEVTSFVNDESSCFVLAYIPTLLKGIGKEVKVLDFVGKIIK
ncbi:MAG: hypothetical protein COB02_07540 [Candidatus Cloacimonadota bacterium]|nr:MAG: hypothetical protein COB02_07540 [Candidatus Cloacimonadota bacterium]